MNGSTDHSQGPLVVCIQSRARQQIGEYLSSKSYRILEAENVEQGLTLARLSSPDCVIVLGHGLAADDLAGFQNQVAEIDDKRIASMIVLTPGQREMQSQLRTNDLERILVQPVSLRQVRVEMESALNCRMKAPSSSPLEAADEIKS